MGDNEEWKRCRHWIVAALENSPGLETIEDVESLIAKGVYQFWPGRKSAAITEIVQFPNVKALVFRHGGGDLEELTQTLEPFLCNVARQCGCTKIMGEGREGWERVTRRMGYRFAFTTMQKDI